MLLFVSLGTLGIGVLTFSKFMACVYVSAAIGLCVSELFGRTGKFTFDFKYPAGIYSVFYFLYYILPFVGMLFGDRFQFGDESYIALIILLGMISWQLGMHVSLRRRRITTHLSLDEKEAMALLLILAVSVFVVIYGMAWRVQEGIFFNQAQYVELETTVTDSVRGVLATQLQLPIIPLLGVLAGVGLRRFSSLPKILLLGYSIIAMLVLMLSSQTRPSITAMLFLVLGYSINARIRWNARIYATLLLSSLLIVIVVQGFRVTQKMEFAGSSNQLIYAIENIFSSTDQLVGSAENRALMINAVESRASGGIEFLGVVVREIDARGQPFWGEGIFGGVTSLVPRLFWPEKPNVIPMQIMIQKLLGFSDFYDAVPGPLIQFYFEGGLFGVVIGYATFGLLVGWITKRTFETGAIGWWIFLAFIWGTVANVEQELALGFFGAIRGAALMYGVWYLFSRFSKNRRTTLRVPS